MNDVESSSIVGHYNCRSHEVAKSDNWPIEQSTSQRSSLSKLEK
jgi:hypothetical protein